MLRKLWSRDTADRLRVGGQIRLDRNDKRTIEEIAASPTATRPGRLALAVVSTYATLTATPDVIYVDAGEIVEMAY